MTQQNYKGMRVEKMTDETVQIEMHKKSFYLLLEIVENISSSQSNSDIKNLERALDNVYFQMKDKL